LIGDIIALVAKVFTEAPKPAAKGKNQLPVVEDDPIEDDEWAWWREDEDDDVITFAVAIKKMWKRLKKLTDKARGLVTDHGLRLASFFVAVLVGVVLYAYFHNKTLLENLEGQQRGQKGGNSGKQYKSRGKKAHLRNGATRAVTGKKDYWAYYDAGDVDAIVEVFINGEPVSKNRIKAGEKLAPGDYYIMRVYGNHVIEDEFTITGVKSTHVGTMGDNDDLKAMAARRNGGKAPMSISGKRMKELGFESLESKPAAVEEYCVHDDSCKHCGSVDMFDDCCDECLWVCHSVTHGIGQIATAAVIATKEVAKPVRPNKPLPPVPKKVEAKPEPTEPIEPKKAEPEPKKVEPKNEPKNMVKVKGNASKPPVSGKVDDEEFAKLTAEDKAKAAKLKKQVESANEKLEALVASNPKVNLRHAQFRIDVLKDDDYTSSGVVAWCGIIMNAHAYDQATHFSYADKKVPKTNIWYRDFGNRDIVVCAFFDGCPKPVQKKYFEKPADGTAVYMIDQDAQVCRGMVLCADEQGMFGLQARATYSSEPGDCGCAVINTNGSIVGIHFSAGKVKQDNLFYPVNEKLLSLSPKAACPSPRDA
jgi:hypothetical protein